MELSYVTFLQVMRSLLGLTLVLATAAAQSSVTVASVSGRRSILLAERSGRIHWSHGAVRGVIHENYNGAPVVWSIDKNGVRDDFQIVAPELRHSRILGVAAATDGALAVIGSGRIAFLARFSPDRTQVKVIELPNFQPHAVAVTGEGRMWTIGRHTEPLRGIYEVVLKGFEESGAPFASQIIKLRIPRGMNRDHFEYRVLDRSILVAAGARLAWVTHFGQYIEFSGGGQPAIYVEPPEDLEFEIDKASIALSPSGETFLAMNVQDICVLSWLQRKTGKWIPVSFEDDELEVGSRLLGFDGIDLIALDAGLERGGFSHPPASSLNPMLKYDNLYRQSGICL